jgi:Cu(I)/Ag(I) efflux system membrane fusion protein
MLKTLSGIEMKAFSNEAHKVWMKLQKTIHTKAQAIAKAENLEEQRTHFIALSDVMIDLAKTFQSPGEKLFVQFCPMANDNNGAFWLSLQDEVRNPYYGDQMLTCGEVREEISGR